jgi:hypothetical protein
VDFEQMHGAIHQMANSRGQLRAQRDSLASHAYDGRAVSDQLALKLHFATGSEGNARDNRSAEAAHKCGAPSRFFGRKGQQ